MCRNEVPDEQKHVHDNVLRNGSYIRTSDFKYLDLLVNGRIEIDVI